MIVPTTSPCTGSHDIFGAVGADVWHGKRQMVGRQKLGLAVTVFGLPPGLNFFTELPTLRAFVEATPTPVWSPVVRLRRSTAHLPGPDPRPRIPGRRSSP
jgi:hypothetical protein